MVISCLTVYAIVFSCVTLLIGRSWAATPAVQIDLTGRQAEKRGAKIQVQTFGKPNATVVMLANAKPEDKAPGPGPKVLQSSYIPSNSFRGEKLSNEFIWLSNETHSYFALFDPRKDVTKKFELPGGSEETEDFEKLRKRRRRGGKGKINMFGNPVRNFVVWDTLEDSEKEVRIHYNGVTAKETVVKTGVDDETGKRLGLKLRQLTDGTHFIQLIYTIDDQIQDCEYIRQEKVIDKFLSSFKNDIERAKVTSDIAKEEAEDGDAEEVEPLEEDEGKISRYTLDEDEDDEFDEDLEEEDVDFGSEYRNVTFQIIRKAEDVPEDLSEWLNYPTLKRMCRENHKALRKLVFDKKHGDDEAKKLAEEHIERVKRGLESALIFPGTKWCGKSHIADKYTTLGGFSKTDKCCRTHDHCHPLIGGFEYKYDFYNFRPFTVSHCRCDLRRKRNIMDVLIVPGTKWCGKGRKATKYTSLGGFSKTDKCCRVHDTMCPHWIGSMEKKYGLFNWRINTIMHCRCDKRFRACLKMAKTGTANFVGKLFFNVVQTKCFVLKPQEVCVKTSWWGKCEKTGYRKRAHLKANLSY